MHPVAARRDAQEFHSVLNRNGKRFAKPFQVIHPGRARNLVQRTPAFLSMLRFPKLPERERGHARLDRQQVLRRAQRDHARIGDPWALFAGLVFIDDEDAAYLLAQQAKRCAQTALPAANDDDVIDTVARAPPGFRIEPERFEIVHDTYTQGVQAAHASASSRRRRAILKTSSNAVANSVARSCSTRVCIAFRIPSLPPANRTQMMNGKSKRAL